MNIILNEIGIKPVSSQNLICKICGEIVFVTGSHDRFYKHLEIHSTEDVKLKYPATFEFMRVLKAPPVVRRVIRCD